MAKPDLPRKRRERRSSKECNTTADKEGRIKNFGVGPIFKRDVATSPKDTVEMVEKLIVSVVQIET